MKNNKWIFVIIIFVFACALIAGGYIFTKDKIEKQETDQYDLALETVFPEATKYVDAEYNKHFLVEYLKNNGIEYTDVLVSRVLFVKDELNTVKGLIVFEECYKKYGGIITMAVGIQKNGSVNGYYISNISEAKGLDLKVRDDGFMKQFTNKIVPNFILTDETIVNENEISSAKGCYDASNAVVNGVNASIYTLSFIEETMGGFLS